MTDDRMSLGLITEMLEMLDRHGYARGDNEHTGRAILLISDLAHIYEGSLDHPFGPYISEIPPTRTEPAPPQPASQDAVLIPPGDVKTLLAALDIAADYQRDRAELCADCADQTCPTCESRLRDAQAYDRLSAQLIQTAETSASRGRQPAPARGRPGGRPVTRQPDDSEPSRRPPDYVIVVAASDWLQERYPAAAASLTQALQVGQDRHRDPEPDLEAEP